MTSIIFSQSHQKTDQPIPISLKTMDIKMITGKKLYMKQLSKLVFLSSVLFTVIISCKKDENKVFLEDYKTPVLTASTTTINLAFANADKEAVKFSWTNPDYRFNTGISSQDVSYLVEIDKKGANFNGAGKQTVAVSKDLTLSLLTSQL